MPTVDQKHARPGRAFLGGCLAAVAFSALIAVPARPAENDSADGPAEEIRLDTSDGIRVAAWYYAVPAGTKVVGTVIVVHDLEGSHKSVERLSVGLQQAGFAVLVPDLRGHGGTGLRGGGGAGKTDAADARGLKKLDLEAIAAAAGGRLRDQCLMRGEIEAVRGWIKSQSQAGTIDIEKLCVVGSGLGATLATMWTAADWNWPPSASGPQGRQVRALALVSPVWTFKGVTMSVPLTSPGIQHEVPLLILAGQSDRDAVRLFDFFKKQRPAAWFQQRVDAVEKARGLEDAASGSVFLIQSDTKLSADKLADDPALGAAQQIKAFLEMVLARPR